MDIEMFVCLFAWTRITNISHEKKIILVQETDQLLPLFIFFNFHNL